VEYIEGCGTESLAANAQEALQAAETADYVIVTIGTLLTCPFILTALYDIALLVFCIGERNYAEMLYPIGSL